MVSFVQVVDMILLVGLLLLGGALVLPALFLPTVKKFRSWLKGSQKSYCIANDPTVSQGTVVHIAEEKLRTPYQRMNYGTKRYLSVIEIGRGIFHRRSAIYGEAAKNWRIIDDCPWPNTLWWVYLKDQRGLRIEDALPLINTYPSLQAMLDRIAELEKELKSTEAVLANRNNRVFELEQQLTVARSLQEEWLAGVGALILEVDTDRQRYRSPAAAHIRECLNVVIDWAEQYQKSFISAIPVDKVMVWKKRFPVCCNEKNSQKK